MCYCEYPELESLIKNNKIPIKKILESVDNFYKCKKEYDAEKFLEYWACKARKTGDKSGLLTCLSELMGNYRKTGNSEKGINVVEEGLALVNEMCLQNTVSGATVMLNAATTLKAFGNPEKSLNLFLSVLKTYNRFLMSDDYRFAGLYNNMGLTYCDLSEYNKAEECFNNALLVLKSCYNSNNECAVTCCNLCELYLYGFKDYNKALQLAKKTVNLLDDKDITHDGYHAFTISKCLDTLKKFDLNQDVNRLEERVEAIYGRH